jgi:hypothetical protein
MKKWYKCQRVLEYLHYCYYKFWNRIDRCFSAGNPLSIKRNKIVWALWQQRIYAHKSHDSLLIKTTWGVILQTCYLLIVIGVPGRKVNILGGHGISHFKQKIVYVHALFQTVSRVELMDVFTRIKEHQDACHILTQVCKVYWCWWWNFQKRIILGKLYQLRCLNNKYWY